MDVLIGTYLVIAVIAFFITFVYMFRGFLNESDDAVEVSLGFMATCCFAPIAASIWPLALLGLLIGITTKRSGAQ